MSAVGGGCIVSGGAVAASYEKQTKNKTKQMFFVPLVRRNSFGVRLRSDLKGVGCGVDLWVSAPQGSTLPPPPLYLNSKTLSTNKKAARYDLTGAARSFIYRSLSLYTYQVWVCLYHISLHTRSCLTHRCGICRSSFLLLRVHPQL